MTVLLAPSCITGKVPTCTAALYYAFVSLHRNYSHIIREHVPYKYHVMVGKDKYRERGREKV